MMRGRCCRVCLAALIVVLQACSIPRTAVPAVADVPSAWQGQAGTAIVALDWWSTFNDPALTRYVERALASNTDLRLASARVAEARALSAVQHGSDVPTVNLAGGGVRERTISVVTGKPLRETAYQGEFEASYEVDLWGRVRALDDAADANYLGSIAAREAAALSVASATAATYLGLRTLDERLALARATLQSRQRALDLARSLQSTGYASSLELAQAESEYRATAQVVPQLELAIQRQEHALSLLLGAAPGPLERGVSLAQFNLPLVPNAGIPSQLMRRRPDIAIVEAQVTANDARLASSKADLLPALRLSASFGTAGANILTGDPFAIWSIGGSVLAPLFNGGRLRAQVDANASRLDQALISYEKTVLSAFVEVEDQLSALALLQDQAAQLEAQRVAVENALRIAHNRYQAGYASYLEELDAQRTLFTVEQSAAQLRGDILGAYVNLYRALGGGWGA
jgi:multidrug efflux system outer membrane protein